MYVTHEELYQLLSVLANAALFMIALMTYINKKK